MSEQIIRNEYGDVVLISHSQRELGSDGLTGETPTQIANRYIKQKMAIMGLSQSRIEDDEASLSGVSRVDDPIICFSIEKSIAGSTIVVYEQMVMGLPIFGAGIGVHIDSVGMGVTSAQSSMHGQVRIANADQKSAEDPPQPVTTASLKRMLGIDVDNMREGKIERQVVYRFEPDQRVDVAEDEREGRADDPNLLDLPSLPDEVSKGNHYIVNEVLFQASLCQDERPVNWRALVEPKSGAVLYIRALVACATGMVFAKDPQTQTGAAVTGASSDALLNPFRSNVTLASLTPSSPQPLSGCYVELADTDPPATPAPTAANSSGAFNFNVRTDDFSAVNAYYHCDNLFRTMADYGFDVSSYFDGITFPVPVDHRALGATVNAQAPGNALGNGLAEFRFALLQAGEPVGIATSNRVVWHEFGHALLWDHVNSPNFGFAHSAGDSLAAILNDPGTNADDRFNTFPWVQEATDIGRRHDRKVSDGWAWFGPQYNIGYRGEQILTTTLFRLYRSIGGDSNDLATQFRAALTVSYLIFKAIGFLTSTTAYPEVFVSKLEDADRTTRNFKSIPGGALHKVVRWAFEKQGLFHPDARPGQGNKVMTEGNPPEVDVYIDDGRHGNYDYLPSHWSCQDMWLRNTPDGGVRHQRAIVGQTNYMYVRVKNRGLQRAENVRVDAYHCLPGTGLAFPDDWIPMDTPTLPASESIARGGETIVGPFAFVPTQVSHECLLAIARADDDAGNDTTIAGTMPEHRFVPFDNNIGQRNVHPVLPNSKNLIKFLCEHPIWVRNPLRNAVVCRIVIELPHFLKCRGWGMRVVSEGGAKFELGPRDRRRVVLSIQSGDEFSTEVANHAIDMGDHEIKVLTYLDDELFGGMTYPMSFDAELDNGENPDEPSERRKEEMTGPLTIEEIVEIFRDQLPRVSGRVFDRRIRTIRFELELGDDD